MNNFLLTNLVSALAMGGMLVGGTYAYHAHTTSTPQSAQTNLVASVEAAPKAQQAKITHTASASVAQPVAVATTVAVATQVPIETTVSQNTFAPSPSIAASSSTQQSTAAQSNEDTDHGKVDRQSPNPRGDSGSHKFINQLPISIRGRL